MTNSDEAIVLPVPMDHAWVHHRDPEYRRLHEEYVQADDDSDSMRAHAALLGYVSAWERRVDDAAADWFGWKGYSIAVCPVFVTLGTPNWTAVKDRLTGIEEQTGFPASEAAREISGALYDASEIERNTL